MLWTLLSLLAIAIGYYLYKELTGLYKIYKYKHQGIKHAKYIPLPAFFMKLVKASQSDDAHLEEKKQMSEQDSDQPFSAVNFGSQCQLTLISEKAIRDFYDQETEVTIKDNPFGDIEFLGFLLENGKGVQEKRAMFSKVFHYSNVVNLMPSIRGVIQKHVRNLKKRAVEEGGQLKIDLKKEFSRAVLDDLSACILLGGAENKLVDNFEGMNVTQLIQKMLKLLEASVQNPLNLLPFATALGLNKELKQMKRIKQGLINIIKNEYNKRYNKESLYDKSILDIMIKINKESEKETGAPKFTIEEITSNFELFQFAASDTSFHLSSTTITYLALPENKEYQKRVQEQVETELGGRDSYSDEKLNSLKEVDIVFKEVARLANPATGPSRVVTKDFKVDGHTVYKGDRISNVTFNYEPKHFKDPFKFNPDRFNNESPEYKRAPRMKQLPFSFGQRACLGKYLGEMVVKLILVEVLKEFEVSVEPGYTMKLRYDPLYGVINPDLIMTVRGSQ